MRNRIFSTDSPKAIKAQGVQEVDIQTTGISVYQENLNGAIGYRAANSVNVKVHHIVNVGPVIAAAQKARACEAQEAWQGRRRGR